jgi:hypothetical protein
VILLCLYYRVLRGQGIGPDYCEGLCVDNSFVIDIYRRLSPPLILQTSLLFLPFTHVMDLAHL